VSYLLINPSSQLRKGRELNDAGASGSCSIYTEFYWNFAISIRGPQKNGPEKFKRTNKTFVVTMKTSIASFFVWLL